MQTTTTDPKTAEAAAALSTEARLMPAICSGWNLRARALGLKKGAVKCETDREAYMQGALAALVACDLMTEARAAQLAFVTAVGRLPGYMDQHAARYVEPAKAA
jgi:hypothetical protein